MQAIYPVLIIVLIALNQSPIDSGFSQPAMSESSAGAHRRGGGVMTSTVVFHRPGDGSATSSDASSVEGAMEMRHGAPKDTPSGRGVLDKGEGQRENEKGTELA